MVFYLCCNVYIYFSSLPYGPMSFLSAMTSATGPKGVIRYDGYNVGVRIVVLTLRLLYGTLQHLRPYFSGACGSLSYFFFVFPIRFPRPICRGFSYRYVFSLGVVVLPILPRFFWFVRGLPSLLSIVSVLFSAFLRSGENIWVRASSLYGLFMGAV